MRLIILAAGEGFKLDGISKLLIKDPKSKETVLDKYKRLFKGYDITIVTGYRAVEIMQEYPEINYIYNDQWRITGNSYSLGLALDDQPSVIISSDLFFDEKLIELIESSPQNSIFVFNSENKGVNKVRCKVDESKVNSVYMGQEFNNDPESVGIIKITNDNVLKHWKKNCIVNKNMFAALNIPLDIEEISSVNIDHVFFHEVNTPLDYINLIKKIK